MNEEEKKATNYYKNNEYSFEFEIDMDMEKFKKVLGIEETDEDTWEKHQMRFKTLVNLIEKQQEELEDLKDFNKKILAVKDRLDKYDKENTMKLEKKDKIIDKLLMEITAVNSGRFEYMDNDRVLDYFTNLVEKESK